MMITSARQNTGWHATMNAYDAALLLRIPQLYTRISPYIGRRRFRLRNSRQLHAEFHFTSAGKK